MRSIGLISAPPRWLVGVAVMLTTVMVILDMTIVNVAMPHMMGALGATADQVTWVLTSYIVAEAIVIPLTGFLAGRLGRRRLLLTAIGGFVVFSALCGQAGSLAEMVVFRLLQGAFGAVVIPISQAVLVDLFPGEERGKGMALWGIGVMMGPVLGPSLGGMITEYLNWRMVFYINLPIGLVNLQLVAMLIAPGEGRRSRVDWLGARTIGSSVGISIAATVLTRATQTHWNQLSGSIQPFNPAVAAWLQARGMTLDDAQAPALLAGELYRQASMLAFVDTFWLIGWSFVLLAPLLLLIRARRAAGNTSSPLH